MSTAANIYKARGSCGAHRARTTYSQRAVCMEKERATSNDEQRKKPPPHNKRRIQRTGSAPRLAWRRLPPSALSVKRSSEPALPAWASARPSQRTRPPRQHTAKPSTSARQPLHRGAPPHTPHMPPQPCGAARPRRRYPRARCSQPPRAPHRATPWATPMHFRSPLMKAHLSALGPGGGLGRARPGLGGRGGRGGRPAPGTAKAKAQLPRPRELAAHR